ncbi:hypothetical protein ABVT39_014029 [Epinephelus coioides]
MARLDELRRVIQERQRKKEKERWERGPDKEHLEMKRQRKEAKERDKMEKEERNRQRKEGKKRLKMVKKEIKREWKEDRKRWKEEEKERKRQRKERIEKEWKERAIQEDWRTVVLFKRVQTAWHKSWKDIQVLNQQEQHLLQRGGSSPEKETKTTAETEQDVKWAEVRQEPERVRKEKKEEGGNLNVPAKLCRALSFFRTRRRVAHMHPRTCLSPTLVSTTSFLSVCHNSDCCC